MNAAKKARVVLHVLDDLVAEAPEFFSESILPALRSRSLAQFESMGTVIEPSLTWEVRHPNPLNPGDYLEDGETLTPYATVAFTAMVVPTEESP
jgi:hypothetical protein